MLVQKGRVPPSNREAEQALIGAVLLRKSVLEEVQLILVPDDFYFKANKTIWECILQLNNNNPGVNVDMVTLNSFLEEKGKLSECGGSAYIASLTDSTPNTTNAVYYANIIRNCSIKRQLFEMSCTLGEKAFDMSEDVRKTIDDLDKKLSSVSMNIGTSGYVNSGSVMYRVIDDIHEKMSGKKSSGLMTGFKMLDHFLGGFKPTDFIIIGARPGVGKSALALSIAHNMAFRNTDPVKIGFFSLEMSSESIVQRLLAREASISSSVLRNGKLTREQDSALMLAGNRLYDKSENLLLQDTPNIKLMEIKAQSRRMVREEKIDLVIVDYIGLIDIDDSELRKRPRHEQVSEISKSMKSLARELNIPVICLSQVTREAGKDREPILADLRESGSIEQDADVVILMDDEQKRISSDKGNQDTQIDPENTNKKIKIIVAKQRNGSTGAFNLLFRSKYVSFLDYEGEEE